MKNLNTSDKYFESDDGAIRIWVEQGISIHMRIITETNDPVELSKDETLEVIDVLTRFAKRIG